MHDIAASCQVLSKSAAPSLAQAMASNTVHAPHITAQASHSIPTDDQHQRNSCYPPAPIAGNPGFVAQIGRSTGAKVPTVYLSLLSFISLSTVVHTRTVVASALPT
ncbi:hypothetical protein AN958_07075 [Leucoagaricus sp. SymC.cos]|nr:hypothetical protein AN958_07075 [Leucoagaricus sp. SymC.cos]